MSWGTPTNIGVNNNSTGATLTLTSVTVPAGALICVEVAESGASGTGSCADGVNGSYTSPANGSSHSGTTYLQFFYFLNSAALSGATITYTKNKSGDPTSISAFYVTGAASLDLTTTPTTNSSSTPSITSGTPSASGELFVGCLWWSTTTRTMTQASGWSAPFNLESVNSPGPLAGGYLINSGSGAETFAPTLSGGASWIMLLFSFEVAVSQTIGFDLANDVESRKGPSHRVASFMASMATSGGEPVGVPSGEFLTSYVSSWLGQTDIPRLASPKPLENWTAPSTIAPGEFLISYVSSWHGQTDIGRLYIKPLPADLSAPIGVAKGEFLVSYVSSWHGQTDIKRLPFPKPPDEPRSSIGVIAAPPVQTYVSQWLGQSDIPKISLKPLPPDLSAPIGVAKGEFLVSYVSAWLGQSDIGRLRAPGGLENPTVIGFLPSAALSGVAAWLSQTDIARLGALGRLEAVAGPLLTPSPAPIASGLGWWQETDLSRLAPPRSLDAAESATMTPFAVLIRIVAAGWDRAFYSATATAGPIDQAVASDAAAPANAYVSIGSDVAKDVASASDAQKYIIKAFDQ